MALGAGLGLAIAAATGADPAHCGALGPAIASWILANCLTQPGTLTAAGSAVAGAGALSFTGSGNSLGDAMAASIPAVDAPGIAKWRVIGSALRTHLITFGSVVPLSFAANPLGGPVTGTGKVALSSLTMAPPLSTALGLADPANIAAFDPPSGLSKIILSNIVATATAMSLGFASPPGGGLLLGASTLT